MYKLSYEHRKGLSTRDLMLTALFSAIYVAYSYVSSVTVGGATHGLDTDFVRSALFVLLAALAMKFGPSTLMGAISGLVFALTIPAPFPIYLLPAVLLYGLTYDLYMHLLGFSTHVTRRKYVIIATVISSAVMSIIALAMLTGVGVLPTKGMVYVWLFFLPADVAIGVVGSVLGLRIVKYVIREAA